MIRRYTAVNTIASGDTTTVAIETVATVYANAATDLDTAAT